MTAALLAVAGLAAATAVPAWGSSKPTGPGRAVRVLNLHAAYEAHLGHTKPGKIAGITYARGKQPKASRPKASGTNTSCAEPNCPLVSGGGPVQHHPHVYLLLWGPAWSSDAGEEATASYLKSFYAGLGAQPDDSWSTTTDQYADSSGHPSFSGSVYEGAFQDTSTPPTGVDQPQLAAEADAFAAKQGITDLADAQIVVATQSGTCPSGFYAPSCAGGSGSYCAWHAESNEPYVNLPYQLDAGGGCGENFVNSGAAGTDDGFSIVGGHEYAETITDPGAGSGWIDNSDNISGGEIADKCAWGGSGWGGNDPSGNVTLSTGTFAMQSLWSNAAYHATGAGCVMSTVVTSTALSSSPNPVIVGQQVTYTAAVSPVPDGGKMVFTDGGSPIPGCGARPIDTSTGEASCPVTYKATAGSPHSIRAIYSGDANYYASPSSTLSETVDPATTSTALSSSADPVAEGQQVTYTATVNPVPDGGAMAFTDGGNAVFGCGSVAVSTATGEASCQATYPTTGGSPHSITASYSGNPDYKSSQSNSLAQSVQAPSVTVSGSPKSTGGGVRDALGCSGLAGQSCRVTETLMTTEALIGGKPVAVSASAAKKKHKHVLVGAKSVTIAAGQSATITIKLNATGGRLLKHFGKLPVVVSIKLELNGQLVTVAHRKVTIKPSKHRGKSLDLLVPGPLIVMRF